MLDEYRIKTRLEEMRRRVKIIEKDFKPLDEISFVSNENDYSACEHHLQIAIQCCIDISNYLIARLGMERPKKESSEGFIILAKEGILPKDFAEKISKMKS